MDTYLIETIAGDSAELNIYYRQSNGDPVDLTGYEVLIQYRKSIQSDTVELEKAFTIDSVDGVLGLIKLELTSDDTCYLGVNYKINTYAYGVRLTSPDGTNVKTLVTGELEVTKGVL